MASSRYQLSFTTGGLFYKEGILAACLYFQTGDWSTVRTSILQENLLMSRVKTSSIRTLREVIHRLQTLSTAQLDQLKTGTRLDQNHILWLAACKQYRLVMEFAVEVVKEKHLRGDYFLTYLDFDRFYNDKAEWNKELDKRKKTTRNKLRQVLFRMMREAEILSRDDRILPATPSSTVLKAIRQDDPSFLAIFPVAE